jgi:hypothetical protein
MRTSLTVAASISMLAGCANEYHPEYHPQSTYSYEQNVSYPTTVVAMAGSRPTLADETELSAPVRSDPSRVLVLQSTHLDRPAEVVGVIDAHAPMGAHDTALDMLRQRAAAMGADAVVGVEFHHGEGEGQPTHLSGLAVRFLEKVPYPVDR